MIGIETNLDEETKELVIKARANTTPTNCIGTALFLKGIEADIKISPKKAYDKYLSKMKPLNFPRINSFISWELKKGKKRIISHLGVVTQVNPVVKVLSREGSFNQGMEENCAVTERDFAYLNEFYGSMAQEVKFYEIN